MRGAAVLLGGVLLLTGGSVAEAQDTKAGAPTAQNAEVKAATDAFVNICAAAALKPEQLEAEVGKAGLKKMMALPMGRTNTEAYSNDEGSVAVSVMTQQFADATRIYCTVPVMQAVDLDGVAAIRIALEANPLVGKLDGQTLGMGPGVAQGTYKKPGLDPLFWVYLLGSPQSAQLSIEAWSPGAPEAAAP